VTSRIRSVPGHGSVATALLTVVAGGIVSLASAVPAFAQGTPDASCGPAEGSTSNPNGRLAQTFAPLNSGLLTTAEIDIDPFAAGETFVVEILEVGGDGAPTNTVLAATTVMPAFPSMSGQTTTVVFATPATVTAGQQYALSVRKPGGTPQVGVRVGNDCPGALYGSPSETGSWNLLFSGNQDMVFGTFLEPLPPEPEPVVKIDRTLTLDANKNKVKEGKRVTLTGQLTEIVRQGPCESGQTVALQRKKPSQSTFTTLEQLQTDAAGHFSTKEKVTKTFEYRAQVAETATCLGQTSNTEKVKVKKPK
jgi:hypothetical protein